VTGILGISLEQLENGDIYFESIKKKLVKEKGEVEKEEKKEGSLS
jgi:hypothetical protein